MNNTAQSQTSLRLTLHGVGLRVVLPPQSFAENNFVFAAVFRIWIRMDPHKEMPPGYGSASAWTDAVPDPDPGGKKAYEMYRFIR